MNVTASRVRSCVAVRVALAIAFGAIGNPALAQNTRDDDRDQLVPVLRRPSTLPAGQTAQSSAGQVGQRQRSEEVAPFASPSRRLATRVQNRVQNRVRNRIDRYYDARPDVTSSFRVAEDQSQRQRQTPRR